jgi:hypothetical protein
MTFATNIGNLMMALSSLSTKVLNHAERASVLYTTLRRVLSVHKYFMTQGLVCRDDIIAFTYLISEAAEILDKESLREFVSIADVLNRVSFQDMIKNDYEVAMMGYSLLRLFIVSWKRLNDDSFRKKAAEILDISVKAWKKYGFHEKAKEFDTSFGELYNSK